MTARKIDPRDAMELVGKGCFGPRWRKPLSEAFSPPESMRFINRAMQPKKPTGVIREHHRQQMLALIDKRMKGLADIRKRIEDQPAFPD